MDHKITVAEKEMDKFTFFSAGDGRLFLQLVLISFYVSETKNTGV